MTDWQPISKAQRMRYGTVADLRMNSGRVYRAVWGYRGRCCAWWPQSGGRKNPIALFEPVEFRVVAEGMVNSADWMEGARINHAAITT